MSNPRIMLAAPSSGSGKTMITCGILQALVNRGIRVSSFKCGPDYIDPMFHSKVIGTKSGNMDLFFVNENTMRYLFSNGARNTDVSVVEGVMGYYDGMSTDSTKASSYEVAKALDAPVILIVNARGQGISSLASLKGFTEFKKDSRIKGVIFNQMSKHVWESIAPMVQDTCGVKPLGYVPKSEELVIESRHLGLVTPEEIQDLSDRLKKLAALLEETVDIDELLNIAKGAGDIDFTIPQLPIVKQEARVAVAYDEAFCFYYRDNLELLKEMGAQIMLFSPVRDEKLPEGTDGLILGGGYPELYAERLSKNTSMLESIRSSIEGGMPCLAECGGFMYLHNNMEDMEGKVYPMAGVINGDAYRTKKLGRFGYITLQPKSAGSFLSENESIKAHEFHYFDSTCCGEDCLAVKPVSSRSWNCMHLNKRFMGGFPHLFYYSNPQVPYGFLKGCMEYRGEQER